MSARVTLKQMRLVLRIHRYCTHLNIGILATRRDPAGRLIAYPWSRRKS